ncbi:MAG TPA: hypothetical protein VL263_13230 [Vicinamibacterales bacterium]|jgi:hypothetical protein|nr:hypothetical protein [Vicinamibacterales bacterium]
MDVGLRTPLLDFFRRGEVARELRLMAAEGAVAPRPLEQLGLLVLLSADSDAEVRTTADRTLTRLPAAQLAALLAQSETPTELRDFFASRGIVASELSPAPDTPLVDTDDTDYGEEEESAEQKADTAKRIADMSVPEKVKAALKGTREMRSALIRDPNKMVATAVLSCPKLSEQEVGSFARMANVSEDILRTIGHTRAWVKNYGVLLGLTKNPKTPLALSLNFLNRLNDRDLRGVSIDRNVPEPLRLAAKKKIALSEK